jgi:hypothetical protein
MRVRINREVCPAHLAFCERCLGKFLKEPLGYERRCFEELEEDGSDDLTLDIRTEGREIRMVLNEEQRRLLAGEGWATLLDMDIPMYREG